MIVLDTHAWLWWADSPDRLSSEAREAIDRERELGVCSISCWELAMLVQRNRIGLDRPVEDWVHQALAYERVKPLNLTAEIGLGAALLDKESFSADPADRIIYATTRLAGAQLVTRDEAITRFDPVRTIW